MATRLLPLFLFLSLAGPVWAVDADGDGCDDLVDSFPDDISRCEGHTNIIYTLSGKAAGDQYGSSVSGLGDVNNDGYADFIVGAEGVDNNNKDNWVGAIQIVSGKDASELSYIVGDNNHRFGRSVGGIGDINGNGYPDFVVGANRMIRVYDGNSLEIIHEFLEAGTSPPGFGETVFAGGDINADGYNDIISGYTDFNFGVGKVEVFSGTNGAILYSFPGVDNGGVSDLFGYSVGAADINNDNYDDIIIGSRKDYAQNSYNDSGKVQVFSGLDGSELYALNGDGLYDEYGFSVAGLADITGDNYADFAVGAFNGNTAGGNTGVVYLYSGADGGLIRVLEGDHTGDRFGFSVTSAGDINQDGYDDILVGADQDDNNGSSSGSAAVFSGADGSKLYVFDGDAQDDWFGMALSSLGDINNDGYMDLAVGAIQDDNNGLASGSVRTFSGKGLWENFDGDGQNDAVDGDDDNDGVDDIDDRWLLDNQKSQDDDFDWVDDIIDNCVGVTNTDQTDTDEDGMGDACDLDDDNDGVDDDSDTFPLDSSQSNGHSNILYTKYGERNYDRLHSVAIVGDLNNDGYDDFAAGGDEVDVFDGQQFVTNPGEIKIISGSDGVTIHTVGGGDAHDWFGASVSGVFDVNKDGYEDFVVGMPHDDDNGFNAGAVIVFSGVDASELYKFLGDSADDNLGGSVDSAGDVNGDGYADIIAGAEFDDNNGSLSGSARIYSGKTGATIYTFDGDETGDRLGSSVSGAGDTNNDGYDDIIVGAYQYGNGRIGYARVYSGQSGALLHSFNGDYSEDWFGYAVSGAGDVNSDGYDDVIVGARFDDNNFYASGSATVFSGLSGEALYVFNGLAENDQAGSWVDGGEDINLDGYADVIVGMPGVDKNGDDSGQARVYSGLDGSVLYVVNGDGASAGFGRGLGMSGDINQDGYIDFIVGASGDDTAGTNNGLVRVFNGAGLWVDSDADGTNDYLDADDDNDGIPDISDIEVLSPADTDSDGIDNSVDLDDDNDTLPDAFELANSRDPLVPDYSVATAGVNEHQCALDDQGVKCWGDNTSGQTNVPGTLQNPYKVLVGVGWSCACDDTGSQCWGSGYPQTPDCSIAVSLPAGSEQIWSDSDNVPNGTNCSNSWNAAISCNYLETGSGLGQMGCDLSGEYWWWNDWGYCDPGAIDPIDGDSYSLQYSRISKTVDHRCLLSDSGIACYQVETDPLSGGIGTPYISWRFVKDALPGLFVDSDGDGVARPEDIDDLDDTVQYPDTDNDGVVDPLDWDDDNDGVPDVVDAEPLNNANASEVGLPIDGLFKGTQSKNETGSSVN